MSEIPAGWYPDNADPSLLRWWDGQAWTAHTAERFAPRRRGRRRKDPAFVPSGPLVAATYRMLYADTTLIAWLIAGSLAAAAAGAAVLAAPWLWWGIEPGFGGDGLRGAAVLTLALAAVNTVSALFLAVVTAAALARAAGEPISLREAIGVAWARRRQLLAWALLVTMVSGIMRALERFGIGGVVAALTLNLGWAVVTVFAMPVLMTEGTMPVATLRRSAVLVKRTVGVTLRSNVSLAVPWVAAAVLSTAVFVGSAGTWLIASDPLGRAVGAVMAFLSLAALVAISGVGSALSAHLEAILYRHSQGLTAPGVDPGWLPPTAS